MIFCSVCFGDPASPLTHGYNYAVFAMLFLVAIVLGSFMIMFFNIRRRMKKFSQNHS